MGAEIQTTEAEKLLFNGKNSMAHVPMEPESLVWQHDLIVKSNQNNRFK
jgi:hypothetical protein